MDEVALAILELFKEFDVVAYLRFTSVYRASESLADFEAETVRCSERNPVMCRVLLALLVLTVAAVLWPAALVEEVVVVWVLDLVAGLLRCRGCDRDPG